MNTILEPSLEYRRTATATPGKLHRGLDGFANKWVGICKSIQMRWSNDLHKEATAIKEGEVRWKNVKLPELENRLRNLGEKFRRFQRHTELDRELLRESLSGLSELAYRKLQLRPHPEQIMGALAIERGLLAEMATGEGKTLTIGLAAALAGWRGLPCHVITANDYLVKRDAEWLEDFYASCGLGVGHILGSMPPQVRTGHYAKDITYSTSKEVIADFLRDRLRLGEMEHPSRRLLRTLSAIDRKPSIVMRGLHTVIVDEADHVLIDEAVTPLIISRHAPNKPLKEACLTASAIASQLKPGEDYLINETYKDIDLTPTGKKRIHGRMDTIGMWASTARAEEMATTAIKAREFYKMGQQYVIQEGKVVIVDESTGRIMPERSWKQGLHQAIEAKEGLELSMPTETLSRLSFQRYFQLYRRLSGLTGTASEAREEFWQIYGQSVVRIPTHKPCIRKSLPTRIFASEEAKWEAVALEVARVHALGTPILVGTKSVAASEKLAALLERKNLRYELLNAVRHSEEAGIISRAGGAGRITIATNMAGRGTDIKLPREVAEQGGLYVIATERHESGRVDRQLFGRSARQGEPGQTRMFCSLEDALVIRFVPKPVSKLVRMLMGTRIPGTGLIALATVSWTQLTSEKFASKQRKSVLRQDQWQEESLSFAGRKKY
ncbi:MAG: hypothetical protein KDN22_31625 [Verrucomicrobiae bacterium]|nr:hypothetical protein [Verrucomicrobiae bacterium]